MAMVLSSSAGDNSESGYDYAGGDNDGYGILVFLVSFL